MRASTAAWVVAGVAVAAAVGVGIAFLASKPAAATPPPAKAKAAAAPDLLSGIIGAVGAIGAGIDSLTHGGLGDLFGSLTGGFGL